MNYDFNKEPKPLCGKASFEFTQEGNTLGTTTDYEKLEINVESQEADITKDDEEFYVIKTNGWSIDNIDEFEKLFRKIKNIIKQI